MNRLLVALRAFWRVLTDREVADRVASVLDRPASGPDLRVLSILQRDGRLVDFLQEDIDVYSDAQVGAAARQIHRDCRKSLRSYLTLEPVLPDSEGQRVTVPQSFDPAMIRLAGNVTGSPPFQGILKHAGWRVRDVHFPSLPAARGENVLILAPAEVELA